MKALKLALRLLIGAILCTEFVSPKENNIQNTESEPELIFAVEHVNEEVPVRSIIEHAQEDTNEELSVVEFVRRSRDRSMDLSRDTRRGRTLRRLDGDDDDDGKGGKGKGKGRSGKGKGKGGDDDDDGKGTGLCLLKSL